MVELADDKTPVEQPIATATGPAYPSEMTGGTLGAENAPKFKGIPLDKARVSTPGIASTRMDASLKKSKTISVQDAAVQTDPVEHIDLRKALDPSVSVSIREYVKQILCDYSQSIYKRSQKLMTGLESGTQFAFQQKLNESEDFIRKIVSEQTDEMNNLMDKTLTKMKWDLEESTVQIQQGEHPFQIQKIHDQHRTIKQLECMIQTARAQGFECGEQVRLKNMLPWPEYLEVHGQIEDTKGLMNQVMVLYDHIDKKTGGKFITRVYNQLRSGIDGKQIETAYLSLLNYFKSHLSFSMENKFPQCQHCMQNMPFRNIARHIDRCKPNPYQAWVYSTTSIPFSSRGDKKNYMCIICGYESTERTGVISHIKSHTLVMQRRFNLHTVLGYTNLRPQQQRYGKQMLQCYNKSSDMFAIESLGEHKCNTKACGNLALRLVGLLKEFEANDGQAKLPFEFLRYDDNTAITRNTELLSLLREMDKKVSTVSAMLIRL